MTFQAILLRGLTEALYVRREWIVLVTGNFAVIGP